jgi:hypothetical protein
MFILCENRQETAPSAARWKIKTPCHSGIRTPLKKRQKANAKNKK